ncbi:MAG: hypothetical protein KJ725_14530 [Gammaproteobacteria bacterium]|jgi:hypothetical protein|uniref:hypothetical protein n=1 Tax=Methylotuvimicrobium sp. TaxID=2822413 RepID=UPI001D62965D|nr:hypothetical protein [Gammaproteobacteria bacterium]
MGPYYRSSSQGVGAFFDLFYQHPILMLALTAGIVGVGIFIYRKRNRDKMTRL